MIGSQFIEDTSKFVTLSEPVDDPDAFGFIVEYMYSSCRGYAVIVEPDIWAQCSTAAVVHASIFLMADRLCMEELKLVAFEKVKECFSLSCQAGFSDWAIQNLSKIIDMVYSYTPAPDEGARERPPKGSITDRMRTLIAFISAFWIESYKAEPLFRDMLGRHPELITDLLAHVQPIPYTAEIAQTI